MQFSVMLHDLLIFWLYVMDKYWSDTIWQRTAQDRVIWRRHAEAFAQPRDTTAAYNDDDDVINYRGTN